MRNVVVILLGLFHQVFIAIFVVHYEGTSGEYVWDGRRPGRRRSKFRQLPGALLPRWLSAVKSSHRSNELPIHPVLSTLQGGCDRRGTVCWTQPLVLISPRGRIDIFVDGDAVLRSGISTGANSVDAVVGHDCRYCHALPPQLNRTGYHKKGSSSNTMGNGARASTGVTDFADIDQYWRKGASISFGASHECLSSFDRCHAMQIVEYMGNPLQFLKAVWFPEFIEQLDENRFAVHFPRVRFLGRAVQPPGIIVTIVERTDSHVRFRTTGTIAPRVDDGVPPDSVKVLDLKVDVSGTITATEGPRTADSGDGSSDSATAATEEDKERDRDSNIFRDGSEGCRNSGGTAAVMLLLRPRRTLKIKHADRSSSSSRQSSAGNMKRGLLSRLQALARPAAALRSYRVTLRPPRVLRIVGPQSSQSDPISSGRPCTSSTELDVLEDEYIGRATVTSFERPALLQQRERLSTVQTRYSSSPSPPNPTGSSSGNRIGIEEQVQRCFGRCGAPHLETRFKYNVSVSLPSILRIAPDAALRLGIVAINRQLRKYVTVGLARRLTKAFNLSSPAGSSSSLQPDSQTHGRTRCPTK
eukprot:GHVU01124398.1.p1 GENE.GHVU01124398.1~~GHVU01124398.1.p1  ORF type:complete len:584 (-),score=59.12 GHVU01124398.1:406-2157(-)